MRNLIGLLTVTLTLTMNQARSQTPQDLLASVYSKYDTLSNLTFDVRYTYTSDTLYGDFIYDVLEGTYTMNGPRALFRLGDVEYMQNDSFFVALYSKDNTIMVSDPRKANSGSFLPLRDKMDSLISMYAESFAVSSGLTDSTGFISFDRLDTTIQMVQFKIVFDAETRLLSTISYHFREYAPTNLEQQTNDYAWRNRYLKIEFLRHRFDNFETVKYDENNYIFFEEGTCKPVTRYAGYRVFYSRQGVVQSN